MDFAGLMFPTNIVGPERMFNALNFSLHIQLNSLDAREIDCKKMYKHDLIFQRWGLPDQKNIWIKF